MNTSSVIIALCVTIPAFIAVTVCAIIFYSHKNKNRTIRREISSSHEYYHSYERRSQDDFPRSNEYHSRQPSVIFERSPPLYNTYPINQRRREPLPVFSPIRTTPITTPAQQRSHAIAPSVHAAMPPSYAELFLTPHTLIN